MSEHGPNIFISYHRADAAVAERVRAHLIAHRVTTWMDQYDIPAGAHWPDEIDKGLASSTYVVGLLSPDAVESRNVKNEWDWALQNGKQLLLLMARPCVVPHRYVSINFIDAIGPRLPEALDLLLRTRGLAPVTPSFEPPRTRYAVSGGVSIAWQQFGSGPIDLVYVPGFFSHLELTWKYPRMAEFLDRFGGFARVLKFDKRGTGMSDRSAGIPTMDERIDDIRAVMDAAGVERAVIYGLREGLSLAALFAARFPERTQALMLYGGSAAYVRHPDYPWQKSREEREHELAERERVLPKIWGTIDYARSIMSQSMPSLVNDPGLAEWLAEFLRLSASPGAAIALERMNLDIDMRSVLPEIQVPTLVMYRAGAREIDPGEARYIAERIPGATLRELPGEDQFPWAGDYEPFFEAIEQFLATLSEDDRVDTVLATVVRVACGTNALPTDVIDTALYRFRGRLATHDDGSLTATFDSPVRAIRFARSLIAMSVAGACAGVHIGVVRHAAESVSGPPVEIAHRLASAAQPGQVLASGTVRDLVAGSGIGFQEASPAQAEGIPYGPTVLIVDSESIDEP